MRTPRLTVTAAGLAALLTLAACGNEVPSSVASSLAPYVPPTTQPAPTTAPPSTTAAPTTTPPTTAPPTTTPATTAPATAAPATTAPPPPASTLPVESLAACDATEAFPLDVGWAHPDCVLTIGDVTWIARYSTVDRSTGNSDVTIAPADGTAPAAVAERVETTPFAPTVLDIDLDGIPELLVPLVTGVANTTYAVYSGDAPGQLSHRAGEMAGLGFDRSQNGEVVAILQGAATWGFTFYDYDGTTLTPIVDVYLDAATGACDLLELDGYAALGLEEAAARDRFCNDPVVTID